MATRDEKQKIVTDESPPHKPVVLAKITVIARLWAAVTLAGQRSTLGSGVNTGCQRSTLGVNTGVRGQHWGGGSEVRGQPLGTGVHIGSQWSTVRVYTGV
jgi:hypothetical protein